MTTYKLQAAKLTGIKTRQVRALMVICARNRGQVADSQKLDEIMQKSGHVLKTRQNPALIFRYYLRQLVSAGAVIVEKARKVTGAELIDGAGI
jgi:hypothetical protein